MENPSPFRWFKWSAEVILLAVNLYVRFPLSLRKVGGILHERGIEVRLEIPEKIAEALWEFRDYRDGSILQAT